MTTGTEMRKGNDERQIAVEPFHLTHLSNIFEGLKLRKLSPNDEIIYLEKFHCPFRFFNWFCFFRRDFRFWLEARKREQHFLF